MELSLPLKTRSEIPSCDHVWITLGRWHQWTIAMQIWDMRCPFKWWLEKHHNDHDNAEILQSIQKLNRLSPMSANVPAWLSFSKGFMIQIIYLKQLDYPLQQKIILCSDWEPKSNKITFTFHWIIHWKLFEIKNHQNLVYSYYPWEYLLLFEII